MRTSIPMMRERSSRLGILPLLVSFAMAASCGSPSTSSPGEPVGPVESVAQSVPSVDPSGDAWDVRVTAVGGGGLIDSVGTADVEMLGGTGPDAPWLRFGLVLNYCCGEPNSVVFSPEQWSIEFGEHGDLRIDGPRCDGPVDCTETERRVQLVPNGATVIEFDVFRATTDAAPPLSEGTLTVDTAPLFDWSTDALTDEPMSVTFRLDVSRPVPPPSGDTTPTLTPLDPVTVVGGGLYLVDFPLIGVADDVDELSALLSTSSEPIEVEALGIDWASQAGLVVSIGSDLCPPILSGIEVENGTATPVFTNAGYLECEQPLVSFLTIAAIDRSSLDGVQRFLLPSEMSGSPAATVAVDVSSPTADPTVEPTPVTFGEANGTVTLPPRGEAVSAVLDNGTPVYVVHHHDGTVSALDPRGADQDVDGLSQIVGWVAATRNFLDHGAWDEYGRRLDGFRTTDLTGYATRVVGDQVEIGSTVSAPAGSPISRTTDPPAMADVRVTPGGAITVAAALDLPVGATSWIAASVLARPDGVVICELPEGTIPTEPCPSGSPTVEGIEAPPDSGYAFFGPLLATRTDSGFGRIASTGGYASTVL